MTDAKNSLDRVTQEADDLASSGQYQQAIDKYMAAVEAAHALGDKRQEAHCLGNLGVSLMALGEYLEGISYMEGALPIAQELGDRDGECFLRSMLGTAYSQVNRFKTALDHLMICLEIAKADNDKSNEASILERVATTYSMAGGYQHATEYYEAALHLARELDDECQIGICQGNIGNNYLAQGDLERALAFFDDAIRSSEQAGDAANRERWEAGRRTAADRLRSRAVRASSIDPATVPGGFVFTGLSSRVSMLPTVEQKRQLVLSEQASIRAALAATINDKSPVEAFALIDCVKSLISRETHTRTRAELAGIKKADFYIHGFNIGKILETLTREPDLCVLSFYYTDACEFYAFVAYMKDAQPAVEKVVIAGRSAGRNLHRVLLEICKKQPRTDRHITRIQRDIKSSEADNESEAYEDMMINLVHDFGEAVLPRVFARPTIRRILIVPHKLLYAIPLHAMFTLGTRPRTLEEIGPVTYASSFSNYGLRGKFGLRPTTPPRWFLSAIDTASLGAGARLEQQAYECHFGGIDGFELVTEDSRLPEDLGDYQYVWWSSHAVSSPASWEQSFLQFGSTKWTAEQIVNRWRLKHTSVVMLSACQTGLDASVDDAIDEYCGLDMAVHIAGASTAVSTLWPVADNFAGVMSTFLMEGVVKHQVSASSVLRQARYALVSGEWKDVMEASYKRLTTSALSSDRREAYRRFFEQGLSYERDAFRRFSDWTVYRSFGGW